MKFILLLCFFLTYPISTFAQKDDNKSLFFNLKKCEVTIEKKYKQVQKSVASAYATWDWRITNNTRTKATILIEYKDEYFLFGLHNLKLQLQNKDLQQIENINNYCLVSTGDIPYLYISTNDTLKNYKGNSFYEFLFPNAKLKYPSLTPLLKYFNNVLYTNFEHLTSRSLISLQQKIVHEGVHLFEQEELLSYSPEFTPHIYLQNFTNQDLPKPDLPNPELTPHIYLQNFANENIPNNEKIIDELCTFLNATVDQLDSREYLKYKEKCLPNFQELVVNEICLGNKLMQTIIENKHPNKDSKKIVLDLMQELKNVFIKRTELYNDQDLLIELYWYLVEGVPQYLEQKISLEKDTNRISDYYGMYCEKGYKSADIFYALFTGASIWHGFDHLSNNSEKWEHLASQTLYNVRSAKAASDWIDEFQMILDEIKSVSIE